MWGCRIPCAVLCQDDVKKRGAAWSSMHWFNEVNNYPIIIGYNRKKLL